MGRVPFEMLRAESLVHRESTLAVVSDKPFDEVATLLEKQIISHGISILQVHHLDELLSAEKLSPGFRCRVYEVCDHRIAERLLEANGTLAHVLPWRIAMHESARMTTVTTALPSVKMSEFSQAINVTALARTIETGLRRVLRGLR